MPSQPYEVVILTAQAHDVLDRLTAESREYAIAQLRELSKTVMYLRRTYPNAHSIHLFDCDRYRGVWYFVDHTLEAIFVVEFLDRPQ